MPFIQCPTCGIPISGEENSLVECSNPACHTRITIPAFRRRCEHADCGKRVSYKEDRNSKNIFACPDGHEVAFSY